MGPILLISTKPTRAELISPLLVFQLGQHHLSLAKEKDTEQNNLLAVNYLIKAAKQGRKGAARALQRCWIQRTGESNGTQLTEFVRALLRRCLTVPVF